MDPRTGVINDPEQITAHEITVFVDEICVCRDDLYAISIQNCLVHSVDKLGRQDREAEGICLPPADVHLGMTCDRTADIGFFASVDVDHTSRVFCEDKAVQHHVSLAVEGDGARRIARHIHRLNS